jgi:CRISPR/Cas system CSM-associated protein Csm3 (group 7 of RAMP superfamily)
MHRLICNELRVDFSVVLLSPISILEQDGSQFVHAVHPGTGEASAFIPGPTLRGALRAGAEQVVRSAGIECCDPDQPCSERQQVKQAKDGPAIYKALCSICKVFGSRVMRSHLLVTDSFPAEPIDAPPGFDAISEEVFYGTFALKNFERWQVGMLALALSRLNMSDVQIGANRSAGMGCIALRYRCLNLIYPGMEPTPQQEETLRSKIHGVGQLMGANNPYGFAFPDISQIDDLPESTQLRKEFGYTLAIVEEQLPSVPETPLEAPEQADDPDSAESVDNGDQTEQADQELEMIPPPEDSGIDADQVHGLIDNVLTRQALAWGSYVRTRKGSR